MSTFTLYRFFDGTDDLLYVGLSINPGKRFEKHRAEKPWWVDVSRIQMEQHPDLETLRQAERVAIQNEKPRHNVLMNGSRAPLLDADSPAETRTSGLVGRYFHSLLDTQPREGSALVDGKVVEWQGHVVDRDDDIFIVELFSWLDGCPNGQKIVTASEMSSWKFYDSALEMQVALGCREHLGHGICRGECTHVAWIDGPRTTVCHNCADAYSKTTEIVWRGGKPYLK